MPAQRALVGPWNRSNRQNNYLQLADGRCSLPVAYTLACSALGRKNFAVWVALLDAKLADPTVTGDVRVNWLLARAKAAKLNPASASHYPVYYGLPFLNPLNGRSFLDQALQAAQDPAVKVRVAREIIGRLTWNRDFQGAKTVLQSITAALPADQLTVVAGLQQQLDGFIAIDQQTKTNQPALAKQSHLNELIRRRDQAVKQGDTAAVTRYDGLINAATQ